MLTCTKQLPPSLYKTQVEAVFNHPALIVTRAIEW